MVLWLPVVLLRSITASILESGTRGFLILTAVGRWTGTFFYCRVVPAVEDGIGIPVLVNSPPTPRDSWDEKSAVLRDRLHLIQRRIEFLTSAGLAGADILLFLEKEQKAPASASE